MQAGSHKLCTLSSDPRKRRGYRLGMSWLGKVLHCCLSSDKPITTWQVPIQSFGFTLAFLRLSPDGYCYSCGAGRVTYRTPRISFGGWLPGYSIVPATLVHSIGLRSEIAPAFAVVFRHHFTQLHAGELPPTHRSVFNSATLMRVWTMFSPTTTGLEDPLRAACASCVRLT